MKRRREEEELMRTRTLRGMEALERKVAPLRTRMRPQKFIVKLSTSSTKGTLVS